MTLLYDNNVRGNPGTHVLAIGVGRYPYLLGGDGPLAENPLGLSQLASPPVSLKALLEWFIAPTTSGFLNNAAVPLASIEALASATQAVVISVGGNDVQLEPAIRASIQISFDAWLNRMNSHPDNVGVFYFCGHGLMVADHYLLAEDFKRNRSQPWENAFDISTTIRALEHEVRGAIYYFIDACRTISREKALTLGANPHALFPLDLSKRMVRQSVTAVYATGHGELAYAPMGGEVSRFTSALVCALSGYCGVKPPGATRWDVDGENIASAIRQLLAYEAIDAADNPPPPKQVSQQMLMGSSIPLLRMPAAPKVKVRLDLAPAQRRAAYELYLLSVRGMRFTQTLQDQVFKVELTRGFYEVGAQDPTGALPAVIHPHEELIPPIYPLTLQSLP